MTQTIEQKTTLYDRDLNLWLEEAIAIIYCSSSNRDQFLKTFKVKLFNTKH